MFRRLFALFCALAVAGALSWGATAAPISGSFAIDIVFYPEHDASANTADKLDYISVKFEADLILTFSVSGVDITSTTIFTFRGLEFQSFVISATLGALTIRDTIIFSPTFFEFEELRDQFGRLRWCVQDSLPQMNTPASHANCYYPSFAGGHFFGGLNAHIDDLDFGIVGFHSIFGAGAVHPVIQNLVLARWIDPTGALGNTIRFRKKIADLSLNIAGMVLGVKALFANVSQSPTGFELRSGMVLSLEGRTVSGVGVRGELWIGAKQGLECFGECKPLERFFNAMVTGALLDNVEEEKLFLTNLVIAGIRHDLRVEMHFDLTNWDGGVPGDDPTLPNIFQCGIDQIDNDGDGWWGEDPLNGVDDDGDGVTDEDDMNIVTPLCFVQLTQSGRIAPWGLNFRTTWNFNGLLDLLSNVTSLELRMGDVAVTANLIYWASAQNSFNVGLTNLVSTFDPPGVKVTSDMTFCATLPLCGPTAPNVHTPGLSTVVSHKISLAGTVGPLNVAANVLWAGGVFAVFRQFDVDLSFTVGPVTFVSSTIILTDVLGGQAFSLTVKF
ncbi:hypothetical protein LM602_03690 [Candidatus Acetothermia bacterium]|jgi:hypothetical protein|nr:hypothetical protein [Candidatus Acetothermia bacterium]MCI2431644.1 hypothetical protein [Candidatus Acetothermia bacterium]MCI2436360.1 hypothetical protein [Candidatus Acetothermia bacterium]